MGADGRNRSIRSLWRLGALTALVVLAACDAPTVPDEGFAYDPRLPGGLLYHWPIGATISVYVDETNAPADADLRSAVLAGFKQWQSVPRYRDFELRVVNDPAKANVIIHHRDAPFLVETSACMYPDFGGDGVTFFCPTEAGGELERLPLLTGGPGRVTMDVRVDRSRVETYTAFAALVSHEIGHVLGIGSHSPNADDLMHGGVIRATAPSERDAQTLRWVLRQRPTLRP